MKLSLLALPVMPGEGTAYQYMPPGSDIITVLTTAHTELTVQAGDLAGSACPGRDQADRFTAALCRHMSAERQYLYPTVANPDGASPAGVAARRETGNGKALLADLVLLGKAEPGGETFRGLALAVTAGLRDHIDACEMVIFPSLRDCYTKADLVRLGNRVEVALEAAPSRPHPGAPLHPPWNKLTDAAIGAVDKIRDLAGGRKTYSGSAESAAAKAYANTVA